MKPIEIKNAVITAVEILAEDYNMLTAWVTIDFGKDSQGWGGHDLYFPRDSSHAKIESTAGHFIFRVMEIAGVQNWEKVPGKAIRVKCEGGYIIGIGHIISDDWFIPSVDFAQMEEVENE